MAVVQACLLYSPTAASMTGQNRYNIQCTLLIATYETHLLSLTSIVKVDSHVEE